MIVTYRCFKHFNPVIFRMDLENAGFSLKHENINTVWKSFSDKFRSIIDDDAPLKERKLRSKEIPYMTSELRRAIWSRTRPHKKYLRNRSSENCEIYRKLGNQCVNLRKKTMRNHLLKYSMANYKNTSNFKLLEYCQTLFNK